MDFAKWQIPYFPLFISVGRVVRLSLQWVAGGSGKKRENCCFRNMCFVMCRHSGVRNITRNGFVRMASLALCRRGWWLCCDACDVCCMGPTKIGISLNGSFSRVCHFHWQARTHRMAPGAPLKRKTLKMQKYVEQPERKKEEKKDDDNNSLIIIYVAENYF